MKKRILAILLAFSLVICAAPQMVLTADAAERSITVEDPLRYGWKVLSQMEDAENLLYAYGKLVQGLSEHRDSISVYDDTHYVNNAQISNVVEAVRSDYPEFFWLGLGYSISSISDKVQAITPNYTMTAAQADAAQAVLERNAALLLTGLEDKSDYEISKLLHDRLAAFMSYQYTDNDQTIYGALVEKQAVCAGYASAYQYLLQRAGIPAWKVTGSSIDPSDGSAKAHAWTLVCLDGSWYHTDVTWDDQGNLGDIYYAYLNVPTQQLLQDHALDTFYATYLPDCSATAANYFIRNGQQAEAFDTEQVAKLMEANNLQARLYVTGDLNSFVQGYVDNIYSLISQLGLSGRISYGYGNLGRELSLYIRTDSYAPFPVGVTMTSLPDDLSWDGTMDITGGTLNVHYNDGTVQALAMEENMLTGFDGTAAGVQVLTVTAEGCTEYLTIWNTPVQTASVPGDFDGDGVATNSDVVTLMWHTLFPDTNPIQGDGDLTSDGTVTNEDVLKLLWHVLFPEENPL